MTIGRERLDATLSCHRRAEQFLQVLMAVDAQAVGRSLTPEHRPALENALRNLAVCAPGFMQRDPEAYGAVDDEEADEHHRKIGSLTRRWLAGHRLAVDQAAELRHRVARLRTLYARPIAVHVPEVFSNAARMLPAREIPRSGRELTAE
jgi:hypothetical protein